ncbi:MAG: hypothetical protein HKL89_03515 [Candidatus Dormibacteraeota bacterium]|nr:hypothetical protein [Candidatus Dormibacteraeota bacterium]
MTRQRGQSLVEFALVLPLLLFLLAGGTDLARAYFVGIQVADGARQAALYASENGATYTYAQLKEIAKNNASGGGILGCPAASVSVTAGSSTGSSTLYDQPVTVVCELPMLTPLIPSPVAIRATAKVLIVPGS